MRLKQLTGIFRRALDFVDPPFDSTIRIVDSVGNVLGGVASAITGNFDRTVRVVDSNGKVLDSMASAIPVAGTTPVSSGSGANVIALTSTNIKNLDTTPITLLTAPGAGKIIVPQAYAVELKFGTVKYTSSGLFGATQSLRLNATEFLQIVDNGVLQSTSSEIGFTSLSGPIAIGPPTTVTPSKITTALGGNQPLVIQEVGATYFSGPVVTAVVVGGHGGTGYANGDTGTIDPAADISTGDATYVVSASAGGVVSAVTIGAAGTAYGLTPRAVSGNAPYATQHTTGAGDDGLQLNVTAVTAGDGTANVWIWYQVITL